MLLGGQKLGTSQLVGVTATHFLFLELAGDRKGHPAGPAPLLSGHRSLIQKLHLGHPLTQDPLRILLPLLVVSLSFFVVLILLFSVTDCCYVALSFSAALDFSVEVWYRILLVLVLVPDQLP